MEKKQEIIKKLPMTFTKRLDYYWQSIAFYAIALIIYAALRGTIEEQTISLEFYDPVVALLLLFIIAAGSTLAWKYYKQISLTVGADYIIFKSRFRKRKHFLNEIVRITFGRERAFQMKNFIRVVKIRIKDRRKIIRIRPNSYWNEEELTLALGFLKKQLEKKGKY